MELSECCLADNGIFPGPDGIYDNGRVRMELDDNADSYGLVCTRQTLRLYSTDAISRELLNLIGDMPSVAPTTMPTAYKERPDFGRKAVRWYDSGQSGRAHFASSQANATAMSMHFLLFYRHRKPFRNEARTDGLQLRHWAKEDEPEGGGEAHSGARRTRADTSS